MTKGGSGGEVKVGGQRGGHGWGQIRHGKGDYAEADVIEYTARKPRTEHQARQVPTCYNLLLPTGIDYMRGVRAEEWRARGPSGGEMFTVEARKASWRAR